MNKSEYKKLLKNYLKKGFKFVYFHEYDPKGKKQIILRHDVDFSIEYALEMANIEKELNVKANYFFLTHSLYNFYNVNMEQFRVLGHYVGLHIDYSHPSISREVEFKQFYSIHRPSKEDLNTDIEFSSYNKTFFKNYSSDSNCKEPKELKKSGQLLIHPIWWMTNKGTKESKLNAWKRQQKRNTEQHIKDNIKL